MESRKGLPPTFEKEGLPFRIARLDVTDDKSFENAIQSIRLK
jgi:hypothetical protein